MKRAKSRTPQFRKHTIAVAAAALFSAAAVAAPGPSGGEFRANSRSLGSQTEAAIASDAAGNFVVVWTDDGVDGSGPGIVGRLFNANGSPRGSDFVVNKYTTSIQRQPAVAMDATGDFVVVWSSYGQEGGYNSYGIYGRRFAADGTPQNFNDFHVNTYSTDLQNDPAVAMDAAGDFAVAWASHGQDGSGWGVIERLFAADGSPTTAASRVNSFTTNDQLYPSVAMDAAGDFIVAYESYAQQAGEGSSAFARRYNPSGTPLAPEFHVSSFTGLAASRHPSAAMSAAGASVIAWHGRDPGLGLDSEYGIYARRFDAAGAAAGGDLLVNTSTVNSQNYPTVTMDAAGDFAVAWQDYYSGQNGTYDIYAQAFTGSGTPSGAQQSVNVFTTGTQYFPAIASDADGDFVVAWQSYHAYGGNYDINARRYHAAAQTNLVLSSTAPASVGSGHAFTVTLSSSNQSAVSTATGNATIDAAVGLATGMQISDALPAGTTLMSASGTGWACNSGAGMVACDYAQPLAAQQAAPDVALRLLAPDNNTSATLTNVADLAADQDDPNPGNNHSETVTASVCDHGTLNLAFGGYSVGEAAGTATIQVSRDGGTCGAASVNYGTLTGGTATDGVDYTPVSGSFSWVAGEGGIKTFTVPILDDALDEPNETVKLKLTNAVGAPIGRVATNLTIVDDEPVPSVTLAASTPSIGEAGGSFTFTATQSAVSSRDVTVNLKYFGTAKAPGDYTASAASIVIPAGSTSGSVTITVVDDAVRESSETIIGSISTVIFGYPTSPKSQSVTVIDND